MSFFLNHPSTTEIYTLSLHDALPIQRLLRRPLEALPIAHGAGDQPVVEGEFEDARSGEHTSELQSLRQLVCRLLLEKKKINTSNYQLSKATMHQRPLLRSYHMKCDL